jgi:hypothetical protein
MNPPQSPSFHIAMSEEHPEKNRTENPHDEEKSSRCCNSQAALEEFSVEILQAALSILRSRHDSQSM